MSIFLSIELQNMCSEFTLPETSSPLAFGLLTFLYILDSCSTQLLKVKNKKLGESFFKKKILLLLFSCCTTNNYNNNILDLVVDIGNASLHKKMFLIYCYSSHFTNMALTRLGCFYSGKSRRTSFKHRLDVYFISIYLLSVSYSQNLFPTIFRSG